MAPAGSSKFTPEYLASLSPEYLAEDIGYRLINVVIAFIVLETVFIVLFYASRYVNKTLSGIECWLLMPLSYIFCIAICAVGILIVHHGGAGRHVEAVLLDDPNIITTRSKIDKALEYIYAFSLAPAKLAILRLYLRIFTTRAYRIAAYVVAGLVIATLITSFILSSTMCQPFAAHWDHTIPGGKCLDIMDVYTWISVPNILTDIIMLVLPLPAIYKLQVGQAAKIGIFLTFLAGSSGLITSILRLVEFQNAADLFKDPTYKCIPTFTFTIVEPGVYMIAACMPTLRPLKRRVLKNFSISSAITSIFDKSMGRTTKGSSIAKPSNVGAFHSSDVQLNSYKSDGQNSFSQHSVSESKGGFILLEDDCQFVTPLSENGTVRREQRGV